MSHRRDQKQELKKNKNAQDHDRILRTYLQEIDDQLESLRKRIKIIKKLRDAIYSKLI
jgi:hypothetical protein